MSMLKSRDRLLNSATSIGVCVTKHRLLIDQIVNELQQVIILGENKADHIPRNVSFYGLNMKCSNTA